MDGYAVEAATTFHASPSRPVELASGKTAFPVNTGNPLPDGCDAIIMIEHVTENGEGSLTIEAPAFPWQHVRKVGEDIVATELLFPGSHEITSYCIGALLSGGIRKVEVFRKPAVAIVPTGTELVSPDRDPALLQPGEVIESNSHVLGNLVEEAGGRWIPQPPVADDATLLADTLKTLLEDPEIDMVLTVGGSSAGTKDFTRAAMADLGDILVHGVTMMPGKPVVCADINGKPAFGMPGYPVSAIVAFEQLVRPLIRKLLGQRDPVRPEIDVLPARNLPSKLGNEEFIRVRLGNVDGRIIASPLPRGAGCITSLTEADGILRVPAASEGVTANHLVSAELLRPAAEVDTTLVVIGSHDNALDILADLMKPKGVRLSSSHVGSMGGLVALKNRTCHLSGSHLLDTETGTYNETDIKKVLPGEKVVRVHLAVRSQGLMVQKGNPKGISGIRDLVRDDVRFINRQPGSGTRILLDWELKQAGMSASTVRGYGIEAYTHMEVAAAVAGGAADCGLGILAASRALGLDFVSMTTEEYDLVIPESRLSLPQVAVLLETLESMEFTTRLADLGGYDTTRTGMILPVSS